MLKPATCPYIRPGVDPPGAGRGERFDIAHQPVRSDALPVPGGRARIPFLSGPSAAPAVTGRPFAAEEATAPWYVGLRRVDSFRIRHDRPLPPQLRAGELRPGIAPYVKDSWPGRRAAVRG